MALDAGKKLSPQEHVFLRPDTYVGSIITHVQDFAYLLDISSKNIPSVKIKENVHFNQGLFNCIREIGSNCIDNNWRSKGTKYPMTCIKIEWDGETKTLSFYNDGNFISVKKKEYSYKDYKTGKTIKEVAYPAEILFGDFLAGTNFEDSKDRKTSGKNGMGSKVCSVFSKEFEVEHTDPESGKKFSQTFSENAKKRTNPIVSSYKKSGYTKISFKLDFEKFKYDITSYEDEFIGTLGMYVLEMAALTSIPVSFKINGKTIKMHLSSFDKYAKMFYPSTKNIASLTLKNGDECVILETHVDPRMEIPDMLDDVRHMSFVNGIKTKNGGVHVNAWRDAFFHNLVRTFNSKGGSKKQLKTTSREIYPYLTIFIKTEMNRPTFDSQTKDRLNGPPYHIYPTGTKKDDQTKKEEIKAEIENIIKKMMKWEFIGLLEEKLTAKTDRGTIQKNKKRINMGDKSQDANKAGKEPKKCTLYITEGLSAKGMVVAGISTIENGQDYNGVFAVQGKFINVQNATKSELAANAESNMLKEMLNLRIGIDYSRDENWNTLRYHKVCLTTDMDDDGIHIRGLLINFFYTLWPALLERGFIISLSTAVAKVSFTGKKEKPLMFYSTPEYKKWYEESGKKLKIAEVKYLKGLGSINPKDVPGYFSSPKVVNYFIEEDEHEYMPLGFDEKKSDMRKEWIIRDMKPYHIHEENIFNKDNDNVSEEDEEFVYEGKLGISTFVDTQLIIYHRMALRRALPNFMDGFKETQRKAFYAIRLRNYKHTTGLEKVAGAVGEITGYHHGDISLKNCIRNMAVRYPGSNNIPLLQNDGQFGCVDPNTPIMISNCEVIPAHKVRVGMLLVGDDGKTRKVEKVVSGVDEMYEIKQSSGMNYIVNSLHILTLHYINHKKIIEKGTYIISVYYNARIKEVEYKSIGFKTKISKHSTKESAIIEMKKFLETIPDDWAIFDINVKDYLNFPKIIRDDFKSAKNKTPFSYNPKIPTENDPYQEGCNVALGNKSHISSCYIMNDENTRRSFLTGFIDARREMILTSPSYIKIPLTNLFENKQNIIVGLEKIAISLGIECYIKQELGVYVLVMFGENINKLNLIIPRSLYVGNEPLLSSDIEVKSVGKGLYVGWYIDGNERFLLGDGTITHNTRLMGGKDAASARYIATALEDISKFIFPKIDDNILKYNTEDGVNVEFQFFLPVLCMLLINGAEGIASGYSTNIPNYNPEDILLWTRSWLNNKHHNLEKLKPWYRGITGDIELEYLSKKSKYPERWSSKGVLSEGKNGWWNITDLPVGKWTNSIKDYLVYLETGISPKDKKWKKLEHKCISDFKNYSTANKVHFMIKPSKAGDGWYPDMDTTLKCLQHTRTLTNMVAIDNNNYPIKFKTPEEILEKWCNERLYYYNIRHKFLLKFYNYQMIKSQNKINYIQSVISKKLDMYQEDEKLKESMISIGLVPLSDDTNINIDDTCLEDNKSFDYLLSMQMRSMTTKKVDELKKETNNAVEKLEEIKNKTGKDLWLDDLLTFEEAYKKYIKNSNLD